MKRLILIPFFLYAGILSENKQKSIALKKDSLILDAKEKKLSWIMPINFEMNMQNIKTFDFARVYNALVSINQPIFKSGAIYYSIKYAKKLKNYNKLNIEAQKRELVKKAYDLVYEYNIAKLQKKILFLEIENAKIDVQRKKEQYLSGIIDSTFLDNAILKLNQLKLNLEDLNLKLLSIEKDFNNLSDLDIKKVKLPVLKLISIDQFVNFNLDYLLAKEDTKLNKYLYLMKRGDELLTLMLNANYTYEIRDRVKSHSYFYGLKLAYKFNINSSKAIQKRKIAYLLSKIELEDKKRELKNRYKKELLVLKSLKNKEKIYEQNTKIYQNLIQKTVDSIDAGEKTELDLEILQNSKNISQLNKELTNLKYQKELLNLYYKLKSSKM